MNENFVCSNCYHTGALNEHGRCARCDSNAVVSLAVLTQNRPHPQVELQEPLL